MSILAQVGLSVEISGLFIAITLLLVDIAFVPMILSFVWWAWCRWRAKVPSSTLAFVILSIACIHLGINLIVPAERPGWVLLMMVISALLALTVGAVEGRDLFRMRESTPVSESKPVVEFRGRSKCRVRWTDRCIELEGDHTTGGYLIYPSSARHEGEADGTRPVSPDELAAALVEIRRHCSQIGFTLEIL